MATIYGPLMCNNTMEGKRCAYESQTGIRDSKGTDSPCLTSKSDEYERPALRPGRPIPVREYESLV